MAKLLKIDFINSITDLGGRWSEDRDCEKMDDLKTKLKVDVTKDGCTETKGFGAISGTTGTRSCSSHENDAIFWASVFRIICILYHVHHRITTSL